MKVSKSIKDQLVDFVLWSVENENISFESFFGAQERRSELMKKARLILNDIDPDLANLSYYLNWALQYPHLPHQVLMHELDNDDWIIVLIADLKVFMKGEKPHLHLVK